ncbi:hypothetical protein BO83DRAFT_373228 [Aspergillus eucalypticola CBS 122712]|uniref:Zn(2)-C6 fungal-type domain-containing protein n=1 Tax=Aspergillus eucalypticola (strain CBS 122712 / IBT 29274) TaxID=1448314 RepID=A0A317UKU6_ASPEC|nr:uncharacterized protein BO83DRAFT_373228 [Aspergillus eucalypticola CBS 122712]PWY61989.1 hypothetical protein BO83DRAFT_373228 [Aspergillus eucalypticola CBS 122712]
MFQEDPEQPVGKKHIPPVALAVTQSKAARPTVVRKKFAKPPVKVACLACRASRTRCDGKDPCIKCSSRNKYCSYLPSRRGGSRKTNKPYSTADSQRGGVEDSTTTLPVSADSDDSSGMVGQIDVLSVPRAGLRSSDFPIHVHPVFADLFVPNTDHNAYGQLEPTRSPPDIPSRALVRTYGSEDAILNAYYDLIHNHFPMLPPRVEPQAPDQPLDYVSSITDSPSEQPILVYKPRSPLSLSISAIVALVPHPNDPEPWGAASVICRRTFAHMYAQLANEAIKTDCELHAWSTHPPGALTTERPLVDREPFHPKTPVELESLLALLVLSTYEYNQQGNLIKMRYHANQALAIALDMSLHSLGEGFDKFAEARRRAWWMTYYCVLQGSIVSTTPLGIIANDPQSLTPYPRFSADPDGWSVLIQAQRVLASATHFILNLIRCPSARTNIPYIYERMQQLETWARSVLTQSNVLPIWPPSMGCGGETEFTTAKTIRAIARSKLFSAEIKVRRFRALLKHCDHISVNSNNTVPSKTL